jgi:hypothetical protein
VTHTTVRTARKVHQCCRCAKDIRIGERYLSHVASPNDNDLGNVSWWREKECVPCAEKCGWPVPATEASLPQEV